MRVLLLLEHSGQAARLDGLIAALIGSENEVLVMLEKAKRPHIKDGGALVSQLERTQPGVRHVPLPVGVASHRRRAAARRAVRRVGRRLPLPHGAKPMPTFVPEIEQLAVDLVVSCPPVESGGSRATVERAARYLRLPMAVVADEWDDLLARPLGDRPHALCVWNDAQADAAIDRHAMAPERVLVTGATGFDGLLSFRPTLDRATFCSQQGLDPARAFRVLVAGYELAQYGAAWVFEQARALRGSAFADQLLVIGHDADNVKALLAAPLPPEDLDGTVVWAKTDAGGRHEDFRSRYQHALHHAEGAVAAKAAPLLDAALLGRSAHLLTTAAEPSSINELERVTNGAVRAATAEEGLPTCAQDRSALYALIRPRGAQQPVAPVLAGELQGVASGGARRAPHTRSLRSSAVAKGPKPQRLPSFRSKVDAELDLLRFAIREATRDRGPVLAGPFSTEVGFELLYWIPFLRWAVTEFPELRERLVVVSRGGTASWSADFAAGYVDLYSVSDPAEVLRRRDSQKQREATAFDLELLDRVRARLGTEEAALLHPSVFFKFYYRVLKCDQRSFPRCLDAQQARTTADGLGARYRIIDAPLDERLDGLLPDDFVAVRFYARPSLPDTVVNRSFISRTLERLTRTAPVVLLNNGMELDDHVDFAAPAGAVTTIDHLMAPANNLAVQTAVIARARAFVGTYGGLAYLGPHLGVPSLAFSSEPEHTHPFHLDLAQRMFASPGFGSLAALRTTDLDLIERLTSGALAPR